MNNCLVGVATYHKIGLAYKSPSAGMIVSYKSCCQTQNNNHAIGVRSIMCNWRYTVQRPETSFVRGGGMGCGTIFKRGELWQQMTKNAWLTINQRGALTLSWEEGQRGPTLATAVNERKAIDRNKDLNVCVLFNTLIMVWVFRGSPNWYLQFYTSKSVVLNYLF